MSVLTPHQQKVLSTSSNLALTANAGSGKTFVLARKYLSALTESKIDISNIAAITFTDKAASELYSKISKLIDEKISSETDHTLRKNLEIIRRKLISANISTIHSFCIDILRAYPVESQLDARFVPIDEQLSKELIELAVEETIRAAFDDTRMIEDVKYLIRIFGSKGRFENELIKLIKNRKNVFAVEKNIYSKSVEEIINHFEHSFTETFNLIWRDKKKSFIDELSKINSTVLANESSSEIAIEIADLLNKLKVETNSFNIISLLGKIIPLAFTKDHHVKKAKYLSSKISGGLEESINYVEDIIGELNDFCTANDYKKSEHELAKIGQIVLNFFDEALSRYEARKKTEGYIDYEDILLHTKMLLENKDVRDSITEKYRFILVDEFQDTNEIQYQIFLPILDYLKKGNLFIVGDEKQSIYKFRDAEIEIFNLTRDDIKTSSGENNLLVLPDSFRMTPVICAFCNHIFNKLFAEPKELFGEVPAADLVCARSDDKAGKVEFLINLLDEKSDEIDEAKLIAKKILNIVSTKSYLFKDITILVRKRKHFKNLEKAFLDYQIPYVIAGGRGFYQRQTISDIFNYLSFLADENNNAALVGVLRSPFFSISDSILFEISLMKGDTFWRKFDNYVNQNKPLQSVKNTLLENLELCDSIELPQLLNKIVTDRNYLAVLASRKDGEQEVANIEKLISIARNFNSKGFRNLYDFISTLKESITGIEDEAQAAVSDQRNTVQMMTIHQAKGLEFPVVFLYRTSEQGQSVKIKTGQIEVNKKFGLLAKLPANQDFTEEYTAAPIVSLHNFIEEKKELAELKRLLYVAITRAKDELYISSSFEEGKSFAKDSFIKLLSEGLNDDFTGKQISFGSKLEFLKINQGKYYNSLVDMKVDIPITTEIEETDFVREKTDVQIDNFEFNVSKLGSDEKGEIISATKVSIYHQCPLKYFLTYEYGFGRFNSERLAQRQISKNYLSYKDEDDEADDRSIESGFSASEEFDPALFGSTVHKILENETEISDLDKTIESVGISDNKTLIKLKSDLTRYFNSRIYKEIKPLKNYKNEYEIYLKENDYYLHGVIDKIIFDGDKIRIFDYKTDELKQKEVKKQAEYYLIQLKFYLYIASRLFNGFENFEGSLVFIQNPDNPYTISYSKKNLNELGIEINSIITDLRNKKTNKNISHCMECPYSGFTKKCIVN